MSRASRLGGWNARRCGFAMGLVLGILAVASAQTPEIVVEVGGMVTIPAPGFQKAAVIDIDKADFEIRPDGIRVRGKEVGQTRVLVWDQERRTHSYLVTVVPKGDLDRQRARSLTAALAADPLTRGEPIGVSLDGDTATLSGTVTTKAVADRAVELVQARVARVSNQLNVGGQRPAGPLPQLPPPAAPGGRAGPPMPGLPTLGVRLDDIAQAGSLELSIGEARLVTVPTEIKRALIADDAIADVVVIPPRELAVIAKHAGDTTLMVWYLGPDAFLGQQLNAQVHIRVTGPPEGAVKTNLPTAAEIDHVLGLLGIRNVQVVTRYDDSAASVILGGTVPSALHRSRAEQAIAALFPTNTRISNFIEIQRPPPASAKELEERARKLERMLAEQLPNAAIRVQVKDDPESGTYRVYLSGDAAVPADRLKAEQIVQFELGNAALITNHIVTPLPPPPAELLGGPGGKPEKPKLPPISEALAEAVQSSGATTDRVYLDVFEKPKKLVVLRGQVRNDDEQSRLLEAVGQVLEVYENEYELRDTGLSVKTARVVTEVQIIELSASDSQQLGLVYGFPQSSAGGGGGTGGGTSTGTTVSARGGQLVVFGESAVGGGILRMDPLAASIRALVTENRARLLQQPYIASNDQQEGSVELVREVPLPSTTTTQGGGTSASVEFKPVGIRLLVTPVVSWAEPQNQIEMTIEAEVSAVDFGVSVVINGSTIPSTTTRRAVTVVTVDDGESFVIGGLTSESERKNVSRLPFLSDIPLIGSLFRYTDKSKEQTTVVVVMTPRIKW